MQPERKERNMSKKLPEDLKEKTYLTRDINTSMIMLTTKENDLVLDALQFVSQYADIRETNRIYLYKNGLLNILTNIMNRDICVLRLSLRLINSLLDIPQVFSQFEEGKYDDIVAKINKFYLTHHDAYVKDTCLLMLIKLTKSYRITNLIFTNSLLQNFASGIKNAKTLNVLQLTMEFFLELLKASFTKAHLPIESLDIGTVINHLNHKNPTISKLVYQIIERFTSFNHDKYQEMFKKYTIVEKMMDTLMDPSKNNVHDLSLQTIFNSMQSNITDSYFIESLQFLKFCLWIKTCDDKYLKTGAEIFLKLSSKPSIRQILFDLSVETAILSILRSEDKHVLHKAFEAIINMIDHSYCCEAIVTPEILKTILDKRQLYNVGEDPIVLNVMAELTKKSPKCVQILNHLKTINVFIALFLDGLNVLSETIYISIINILYYTVINPDHQEVILTKPIFQQLIYLLENSTVNIAIEAAELLSYCIMREQDVNLFIELKGPAAVVNTLKSTKDIKLFGKILGFLYTSLANPDLTNEYLRLNLADILQGYSEYMTRKVPLITSVLQSMFQISLPLKFFKIGRIELSEKLRNGFYLIKGNWKGSFPALGNLVKLDVSSEYTAYYVNFSAYPLKMRKCDDLSSFPLNTIVCQINYGKLTPDIFLPQYVCHINQLFLNETNFSIKIKILAQFVHVLLDGPGERVCVPQKYHSLQLHLQSLKTRLGTNVIPIGMVRIGMHCEKALLFKVIADILELPCTLVHENKVYWNEVVSFYDDCSGNLATYVVDLFNNIGNLMPIWSREANQYCNRIRCM